MSKPSTHPPAAAREPILLSGAWLLLLACVVALAYWPGRTGGFVLDDQQNIVLNNALHVTTLAWPEWVAAMFSSPASAIQRPLAMLTFAANHYFTGLDPVPMKLTNIAIHIINVFLVWSLVRCLLELPGIAAGASGRSRAWSARFAAAAWALHPINLMPVLYVVQRMESLSHTFVFAGLWLYLAGRKRQLDGKAAWHWVVGGLGLGTTLGLLAKESAVLLPLYAFCAEACVLGFRNAEGKADRRLHAMYIAGLWLPAMLGLAWLWPQTTQPAAFVERDFSLADRLLTEPRVVLDYMRWILLPDLGELSLFHDDYVISRGWTQPASTLAAIVVISILAGAAWLGRRRAPLAALGVLWFFCAQLLTATILPLELVYEHRNYFASLGIVLAVTHLLLIAPSSEGRKRVGLLVAGAFVVALATLTTLRAREWSDPVQFRFSEAAKKPGSPRASFEAARLLVGMVGRSDSPLLPEAWRALERAKAADPRSIMPHQSGIMLAERTGTLARHHELWTDMQARLRAWPLNPQNRIALINLANCAADYGCRYAPEDMISTFNAALVHGPDATVLSAFGKYALHVLGDTDLALRLWTEASALEPTDDQFRYNLARLLLEMGRYDDAQAQIRALRAQGRFGRNEVMASELEARLAGQKERP